MRRNLIFCFALVLGFSPFVQSQSLNGFDLTTSTVPVTAILHGGPPKDGIPAILKPNYTSAEQAVFMRSDDVVLGFNIRDQHYAYPRFIMNWHELVNDEVGGEPFMVSYCPLCGSGMAFSSKVNGEKLVFGVSGLVMNSDVLFYDTKTESLWSQLDQTAITGKYAGSKLESLYLEHTTWDRWLTLHPDTKVLSENQGRKRPYRRDPYTGYESSSGLYFKVLRTAPKTYHTKERVLGIKIGELSKAYPFVELRTLGKTTFDDQLGDTQYQVHWDEMNETATIVDMHGNPQIATQAYWFAWYAFHPATQVFKAEQF